MRSTVPQPQAVEFDLQPYNPDLRTVQAVEVMRVGTWNDIEFSLADLDEMIAAFNARPFSVPLKVGHGEVAGMPAYGWVDRIFRRGEVLFADFRDVPGWIFDCVFVQHQYDHVSIEVFFNLKVGDKTFKRVLKAVALLGAETPAVSGLSPLRDAIFAPAADQYEKQIAFSLKVAQPMPTPTTPTPTTTPAPVTTPAPAAAPQQADFAAMQAQLAQRDAQIASLTQAVEAQTAQTTALLATVAGLSQQRADDAVTGKLGAIKVPAVREHFRHLYSLVGAGTAAPKVFKFKAADGKETDRTGEALLDELVAQFNKLTEGLTRPAFQARQSNPAAAASTPASTGTPDVELSEKVNAYMAEKGLARSAANFTKASQAVLAADADLRDRYAAFTRGETVN